MTRYVVTGGAGFIGSALVRALLTREDAEVRVIDNLLTGYEKIWRKCGRASRWNDPTFKTMAQ